MTNPLFASIRKYSGAPMLSDELVKHQEAIKTVLRPIRGLHAFYLVKTTEGAVSLTLCEDKAGVDESNRVEATWLKDKLPTFSNRAPEISTGEVRFQLEGQPVRVGA